jgi:DNA-binding FrmR family transcriptional regulator
MSKECCTKNHPDHSKELSRLNRVAGQVEGVKKMIDERRYCPDILTQLKALRSAVKTIETSMLKTHLMHCVKDAMQSDDADNIEQKVEEIAVLFKRYEE